MQKLANVSSTFIGFIRVCIYLYAVVKRTKEVDRER